MLVIVLFFAALLSFCFVIFFGAPYLPVLKNQKAAAFELLDLKPGQVLIELGSGDGRVLKTAAGKGLYAVGYELNPLLVIASWLATIRYRNKVKIIWGNYWTAKWPEADGIYVFLYTDYMEKLDKKIRSEGKKVKIASVTFKIPGKKPAAEKDGVFLYRY